jgi:[protein-PII] uridylyltransferase
MNRYTEHIPRWKTFFADAWRETPRGAARAKRFISRERNALFASDPQNPPGMERLGRYALLIDTAIQTLMESAAPADMPIALLALGGYGRGELYPASDVDLMLLYRRNASPAMRAVAGRLFQALWDAGLELGHSFRSFSQSRLLMEKDLPSATSLLEARFLAGDAAVFDEFRSQVLDDYSAKHAREFCEAKIEEAHRRHQKRHAHGPQERPPRHGPPGKSRPLTRILRHTGAQGRRAIHARLLRRRKREQPPVRGGGVGVGERRKTAAPEAAARNG